MSKHHKDIKLRAVFIINNQKKDLVVVNRGKNVKEHRPKRFESNSSSSSNSTCEPSSSSSYKSSSKTSSSSSSSSSLNINEEPVEFNQNSHNNNHSSSSRLYEHSGSSNSSSSSSFSFGPTGPEGPTGPCCGKTVLFWNSGNEFPDNDSPYIGWGYISSESTTTSIVVPYDGTLSNLYAQAPGNSGCTGTISVYVNGVLTTVSATATGTTFNDTVNTVEVNAGDLVSIHCTFDEQCRSSVIASIELKA